MGHDEIDRKFAEIATELLHDVRPCECHGHRNSNGCQYKAEFKIRAKTCNHGNNLCGKCLTGMMTQVTRILTSTNGQAEGYCSDCGEIINLPTSYTFEDVYNVERL